MKKARPCEGPGFFVPLVGGLEDEVDEAAEGEEGEDGPHEGVDGAAVLVGESHGWRVGFER